MADVNLDNQHADYKATLESRTRSRDLYEGWSAVKAKAETYLFKEPREKDEDYLLRVKRAVLDNWVEKIVQARQAVIFRKAPKRTLPKPVEAYINDVDRNGTNAGVFFEAAAFDAQVDGIHWVLVDMPQAPEAGHLSLADEKNSQHRPFFQHIPAANVIDWEIGADGAMLWAVITQSRAEERLVPGTEAQIVPQWKIWYRDRFELYEAGGDDKKKTALVSEGPNTSGVVPLVPFFGIKRTEQSGLPVVEKLLEHVTLIYNKRSDLDRSERIAAHPTPYVISPAKLELLNMANGFWICSKDAAGVPIEVGMLETSGIAFSSIRESIAGLVQTIQANALAQAKKDSAQTESAENQKEYKSTFNSSLRSASLGYESSERRCWEIFGLWIKTAAVADSVAYNRDFDDRTIDEAMISRLLELAGGKPVITQATLLKALQKGEIIDPDLNVENEINALKTEEADAAEALAKTLVPVAESLPPEPSE